MWFLAVCVCLLWSAADAVVPTGELTTQQVGGTTTVVYVAPGSFSAMLSPETEAVYVRLVRPTSGTDGCDPVVPTVGDGADFYLLVSRGNCSFIDKAVAAKNAGALGVVVYNSVQGIYQGNSFATTTDYECANGAGYVSEVVEPVYSDAMNALMPTVCTENPSCTSKRCLVTNETDAVLGTKVCCAWDLYTTMGTSYVTEDDKGMPNVPAVFIRMQDADTLMGLPDLDALSLDVAVFARPTASFDYASVLIWLIAVVTVASGAMLAAEEDKLQQQGGRGYKISGHYRNYNLEPENGSGSSGAPGAASSSSAAATTTAAGAAAASSSSSPEEGGFFKSFFGGSNASTAVPTLSPVPSDATARSTAVRSAAADARRKGSGSGGTSGGKSGGTADTSVAAAAAAAASARAATDTSNDIDPDSLQITPYHAVGFVVLSSCFLLLMYFIDVYAFVSVLYLAAAAFATSKVFFYPFYSRLQRFCQVTFMGMEFDDLPYHDILDDIDVPIDAALVLSALTSLTLSVTWYFHSEEVQWVWVLQDFLGVSVCIMFLSTVHLPNLQAATMLLGLAFFYDIFFVFISPYVFGSSVMVKVATGPTVTQHSDENFCEKYPSDRDCATNTLPMLLIVPTIGSYESTESMLGLGDIVLPGLLLAWAARLDIRMYGSLSSPYAFRGYFPMVVFGYALGLMAANFAVEYFETGQPALLYIVPLTLGPVLLRSLRSGKFPELWHGLPRMRAIVQPYDTAEREALLAGRASVFPAEATVTGDKTAEVTAQYMSLGPFGRSAMESAAMDPSRGSVTARPVQTNSLI